MAFVENKYVIDGVLYNIMETQDTHDKIQNDSEFASSYVRENSGELDYQPVNTTEDSSFTWKHVTIHLLLEEYKRRQERFKTPTIKKKDLWAEIQMEFEKHGYIVSTEALDKKFRNMKKTYLQIRDKKQRTGGTVAWQYYNTFRGLIKDDKIIPMNTTIKMENVRENKSNSHKPVSISHVVSSMVVDDEENMNVIPQMVNLTSVNTQPMQHNTNMTVDTNNIAPSASSNPVTSPDASFWAEMLQTEKLKLQEAKKLRQALESMVSVQKERNILLAKIIQNFGKETR